MKKHRIARSRCLSEAAMPAIWASSIVIAATSIIWGAPSYAGTTSKPAASQSSKAFIDRFDQLDRSRWFISDGWSNGPYQHCVWSARNVRIKAGKLLLVLDRARKSDVKHTKRDFACAEIQSHAKFGYGTYEVRMKAAANSGLVTAFFTYTGKEHGTQHDEIDFEFLGKDRQGVQLNYFGAGAGKHEHVAKLGHDASGSLATYAFEWRPDSIRWFVNGKLVHSAKKEAGKPFPATPSKIILSIWNGINLDHWLGKFAAPDEPLVAEYDFVAFTPIGEPCHFPESIVCKLPR